MIKNSSILIVILLSIPLSGIGIDIYTPSLPAIMKALDTHHAWAKLTIPIYLLGFGLGQFFTGSLSDRYGRKKILCIGLLLFSSFSLFAAWAPTIRFLLAMRFLQGLAVTSSVVISKAVTSDVFFW